MLKSFFLSIKEVFNRDFAEKAAVVFSGGVAVGFLNYVLHIALGKIVSVDVYGEIESLLALFSIFSILFLSVGTLSAKYHSSAKAEKNEAFSYYLVLFFRKKLLIPGIVILAVGIAASPFIAGFLKLSSPVSVVILFASIFVFIFMAINNGALRGWQEFKQIRLAGVARAFVKLAAGVALVLFGFSLNGVMLALFLSSLAAFWITNLFVRKYKKAYYNSKKEVKHSSRIKFAGMRKYAVSVLLGTMAINLLLQADMVVAKHNLSPEEAGRYGALMIVGKIIFFVSGSLVPVVFSMSAESYQKNIRTISIFFNAVLLLLLIALPACLFYFLFPELILEFLFSSQYLGASQYLGWLGIQAFLFSLATLIYHYLLSLERVAISYYFIAIAISFFFALLFFGKSIGEIVFINIVFQLIAIATGLAIAYKEKSGGFFSKKRKSNTFDKSVNPV
ncbi:MAG: oligosaccharide flippase family protein [Candidatus Moranbacteria bacterium]|nr:oligosaccharide flippase family protein [Candidatus Moranbacteria bacterium]